MPIQPNQVQVGSFYVTPTDQLRKITEITTDDKNRKRVHYVCKSAKKPGHAFGFTGTKSNPALLETFIAKCDRMLDQDEVRQLRKDNIILQNE